MGTRSDFAQVMAVIFAGKLSPALDETFDLKDARRAQERMERASFSGRLFWRREKVTSESGSPVRSFPAGLFVWVDAWA